MNKFPFLCASSLIAIFFFLGCSGGGDPVTNKNFPLGAAQAAGCSGSVHLWGFYEVYIDTEECSAVAVPSRGAMFTVNVVNFINNQVADLGFKINEVVLEANYTDIDIDVTIKHPFPGMPQYHGYDVRGVFMGDGSGSLKYNPDLLYAVPGTDQYMFPDPDDGLGGPDGYTRWFNFSEFSTGGMLLFSYTQGKLASKGFNGTATLNPYKYYADSLKVEDNLWNWLVANSGLHGRFSSGASNTRNYYLRFPSAKGIKYGYAIIASWNGVEPEKHPANAPEAVCLNLIDSSDLYYSSPSSNGGSLKLDISVWDWDSTLSAGPMEDYRIFIESTVLSSPYEFTASDMIPTGGNENYSTYHVEIPADNIKGNYGNELWVIVEEQNETYENDFGVTNLAGGDKLAALFRYDLEVGSAVPTWIKVTYPNGGENFNPGTPETITWTSSGISGTVFLEYSKDNFVSDVKPIASNEPNDGSFQWTVPCTPSTTLKVRISSTASPSLNDASDNNFTIVDSGWARKWGDTGYDGSHDVVYDSNGNIFISGTSVYVPTGRNWAFVAKFNPCGALQWSKKWGGTGITQGYGLAVDSSGNCYITGNFYGTTNFDPDNPGGPNQKTSVGGSSWDAWLVSFNPNGVFRWVRTWGGTYSDSGRGLDFDDTDGIYVSGSFCRLVDFNPAGGDPRQSNTDSFDCFVCKYDTAGNYKWVKTWGSPGDDRAFGVAAKGGNVYITGNFQGTGVNFNPDGSHPLNSNGSDDVFLSAFNYSGTFKWAWNWGGTNSDVGAGVAADSSGNVYCVGYFRGYNVNFNPSGSDLRSANGGGMDSFLSKFNASGNFQWARTWGGSSMDSAEGVAINTSGDVIVTGYFYGTAWFNPNNSDPRTVNGGSYEDAYMSRFDSTGVYKWVHSWGSTMNDRGFGVAIDDIGNMYASGFFNGAANFAPSDGGCSEPPSNLTPAGDADAYLIKYMPDGCW